MSRDAGQGGTYNHMCRSPEVREKPGTPEEVKTFQRGCSTEDEGKQAGGWSLVSGPGPEKPRGLCWGGHGIGGRWSYLHLPLSVGRRDWRRKAGRNQLFGSCCRARMRQALVCTGHWQQDGGRGGFKNSTVSPHGSFSCMSKGVMGGATTTLLLQLGESLTLQ